MPPQYPGRDPVPIIRASGCLALLLLVFMGCLVPFILVDLAQTALTNLHLRPESAMLVFLGILLGSFVNIPITRYPLDSEVVVPMIEPIGGWHVFPRFQRIRQEMVVAVNVGGCVIPVLLALWLLRFVFDGGGTVVAVLLAGVAINVTACYFLARPIPGLGIALPAFLPPLIALGITWIGLGAESFDAYRAPVAFIIGIMGPLAGADLLHWPEFKHMASGMVSIGGAGTWDGIVLSGMLAALLA